MSNPATPSLEKQEWSKAADNAKSAASSVGEMATHAASAVGEMARQATNDVGLRADKLTASAGHSIQEMGDRLAQQAPHSGVLGSASQAVARSIHDGGEYINGAKLSGMADDVAHLVRRNPISAVLIALGLGIIVGRKVGG